MCACVCVCRGEGVTEWAGMRVDSVREEVRGSGWDTQTHVTTPARSIPHFHAGKAANV